MYCLIMTKRLDIHRPSAINPCEYTYVSQDYWGPGSFNSAFLATERATLKQHMANTGGKFSNHEHGGSCHICGAAAMYVAHFHHPKTNKYITTGCICAEKVGMGDPALFRKFHKHILEAKRAEKGKQKAVETLEKLGLMRAWEIYMGPEYRNSPMPAEENTVCDILSRLVKWGNISDRQVSYLRSLFNRIDTRKEREAQRAAEHAAAAPVPVTSDRVPIIGTILGFREPDAYARFPQRKILLESDAGWKVWGSLPASLSGCKRGDKIRFLAYLTRSDKDEKFGFFNRPSKAEVLETVGE